MMVIMTTIKISKYPDDETIDLDVLIFGVRFLKLVVKSSLMCSVHRVRSLRWPVNEFKVRQEEKLCELDTINFRLLP